LKDFFQAVYLIVLHLTIWPVHQRLKPPPTKMPIHYDVLIDVLKFLTSKDRMICHLISVGWNRLIQSTV